MKKLTPSKVLAKKYSEVVSELDLLPSDLSESFITHPFHVPSLKQPVNSIFKIEELLIAYSRMRMKDFFFDESLEVFNVSVPNLHNGFTLDQWRDDIHKQISIIQTKERRELLIEAKAQMEPYIDKDSQIEEILSKIKI